MESNELNTLEALRIQVARWTAHMESEQRSRDDFRGEMRTAIDRITTSIFGNGQIGLKTQVDRIQQNLNLLNWMIVSLATLVGGVTARVLYKLFR